MLNRISLITALIIAIVNLVAAFGVTVTADQLAAINTVLVAAGAVAHSWFNPDFSLYGEQKDPTLPPGP